MIDGVIVQQLKQIADKRGKVMHMLRADSPNFLAFGEIYFSVVNPKAIKAWKRHRQTTQNMAVPVGKIRLVIYDGRQNSSSFGKIDVLEIGEDNYCLVIIPNKLWYGFQGISKAQALIANCINFPHIPSESDTLEINDKMIPYDDWLKYEV